MPKASGRSDMLIPAIADTKKVGITTNDAGRSFHAVQHYQPLKSLPTQVLGSRLALLHTSDYTPGIAIKET
jgi:hypothetical protein